MNTFKFSLMRGGTSKAIFLRTEDMPSERSQWDDFLLDLMGSPDKRQIDGMGGGTSLTSKVAIVGKSTHPDADIDYTFAQVSINDRLVDVKGNCGNISSAVAPFAVNEGLFKAEGTKATVRVFNTNTQKIIAEEISIKDGAFDEAGDCVIPGVPGSGSSIYLSFAHPQGAVTGKLLPTGEALQTIETSRGAVRISIVDSGNPLIFMSAEEMGFKGTELPADFSDADLRYIEEVRSIGAELCGFATREEATRQSPAVPKATLISRPATYVGSDGKICHADACDIVIRMMSMQKPHAALAITGAICVATAVATPGTLVHEMVSKPQARDTVLIAHPSGIMECIPESSAGELLGVKVVRTARRLASGFVYTKNSY